jgi:dipeptidase E
LTALTSIRRVEILVTPILVTWHGNYNNTNGPLPIMSRIFAIGGGEIENGETEAIDRHICESVTPVSPNALFIPTASGDAEGYCDSFDDLYCDSLGCETRHLKLHDEEIEREEIREELIWADLLYVGGGSLPLLMRRWRELDIEPLLYESYRNGTVVAGLSAGAMCWFTSGLTDASEHPEYTLHDCFGWINSIACTPHATPDRRAAFRDKLQSRDEAGIALEDCCAVEFTENTYQILSANGDETAYKFTQVDGEIEQSKLTEGEFENRELLF